AALAEGKGVVGLSAHQGNFPLLLAYLSRQGFPVATISREVSNHRLENYIQASKRLSGIRWMPKDPKATAARQMIAWIKRNRVLVILADQHSGQGVRVPFFGLQVGTPSGPAVFARRLGCPILPMTVVRKEGHHLVRIFPPLELRKTDNPQADIEENTALCNRVIEAWVRENPGQWFTLLSRRFR
ncbi:MAG TPA: lysophospholipid acyltransferase family protein, partial [bacterium]|nr:lysophospholipid acyltransferase family protein [bacterium]